MGQVYSFHHIFFQIHKEMILSFPFKTLNSNFKLARDSALNSKPVISAVISSQTENLLNVNEGVNEGSRGQEVKRG